MVQMLVAGRPGVNSLTFWALMKGNLEPSLQFSGGPVGEVYTRLLSPENQRPLRGYRICLFIANGLGANTTYRLTMSLGEDGCSSLARTLPETWEACRTFTVALGSCYCHLTDGSKALSFPPVSHGLLSDDPIRLKLMCGDQIYMDMGKKGRFTLSARPRPYQRYLNRWTAQSFSAFLSQGNHLFLADDHEFWNNYPNRAPHLSWARYSDSKLVGTLRQAFELFQGALNLSPQEGMELQGSNFPSTLRSRGLSFAMPSLLPIFVLDTRVERQPLERGQGRSMTPVAKAELKAWLRALKGPGVLVIAQPLVREVSSSLRGKYADANLPDYKEDYGDLWEMLWNAPWDVVIAAGDIHRSRVMSIKDGAGRGMLYEVVSSPLSRIRTRSETVSDNSTGAVKWHGGKATYKLGAHTEVAQTFATLTFEPASSESGSLNMSVKMWDARAGAEAPPLCTQGNIRLGRRS